RADDTHGKFYTYDFGQNGDYVLWYYPDPSGTHSTALASGTTPNFRKGLNATNTLAIVANNSTFDLYVNYQKIASVNIQPALLYTKGQFGIYAYSPGDSASQVSYTDLTIWRIS
ncbi:MAG TPA: hypothetical protein VFN35_27665, partial [Ktedonobacteraceae bacterium]|nr:hypothetical protein [Ktedonobacteraceae bacterium]